MYKALLAAAGVLAGSLLMWLLPYLLVPHPHEFDGLVYLVAWWCGIPAASLTGLVVGLLVGAWLDGARRRSDAGAKGPRGGAGAPAGRPRD